MANNPSHTHEYPSFGNKNPVPPHLQSCSSKLTNTPFCSTWHLVIGLCFNCFRTDSSKVLPPFSQGTHNRFFFPFLSFIKFKLQFFFFFKLRTSSVGTNSRIEAQENQNMSTLQLNQS